MLYEIYFTIKLHNTSFTVAVLSKNPYAISQLK